MREILYIEIPTSDTASVCKWLHQDYEPAQAQKRNTPDGCCLKVSQTTQPQTEISEADREDLAIFLWSVQRSTYLKVFRWSEQPASTEAAILNQLQRELRAQFPHRYPEPPALDGQSRSAEGTVSIFEALADRYPLTVRYFQKMPNGQSDLDRVYWWEQRWRESVRRPQTPKQVIFQHEQATGEIAYDLIYIGGALGVIHATVMARLGYRVLLIERLPYGHMNREWNISRDEFQSLIQLGLFTASEFESLIAREYIDGFSKFFDANNPTVAKAPVLHTPKVLNVAIDAEKLLHLCGEKFRAAGGEIWDETEFERAEMGGDRVVVQTKHLPTQLQRRAQGRLLIDAMGTASPIAWQLNGGRAFDSVCPTVGAVVKRGFEAGVWDSQYGDVLFTHGDISRGRQLIWELFPGRDEELAIYLFHYHQVNAENPGSLLEMYEDFFSILPEYRRCDMEKLEWKKPTFGYIPGHFSTSGTDRRVAFDRLLAIGDAASLQSPLVFTGFGSLVRNLPRLTDLLDTALRHNLLKAHHLDQIRAYQSNVSVTWMFSKGMMVPTGKFLQPQKVNAMLNTFFGILAAEDPAVADRFIKDRAGWVPFNRMAIKAATKNPALLLWIWQLAGTKDLVRWLGSYFSFTVGAILSGLFGWLPSWARSNRVWLESRYPGVWFWLLARSYALTYGVGQPQSGWVKSERRSIEANDLTEKGLSVRD